MQQRVMRWLATLLVALAFGAGLLAGAAQPQTVYGADPTPTPTLAGDSNPSGGGGGH